MADSNLGAQAAPTTAVAKPHLELMPPELFEVMAQCLDPRDLFSLRRVSKQCKHKAQKTFLEAWFSEGSLRINDEDSLKEMLKLVDNPVYGPALRKIVIFIDEWIPWPQHSSESPYKPGLQKQRKFQDSGMAAPLLTSVFLKARSVASVTEICITVGAHPEEVEDALRALPVGFEASNIYGEPIDAADPSSARIIFESLWLSDLRVKTLSRTGTGQDLCNCVYVLPIHSLASDPRGVGICKDVLQSITSISMQAEFPDVKDTNNARKFLRCMGSSLEHLSLHLDQGGIRWDPDLLDYEPYPMDLRAPELFLEDLSLPSLRTVELDCSAFSAEILVGFIKRLPSLQKVSLSGMELEPWPEAIGDWKLAPLIDEELVDNAPSVQEVLRVMAGFQEIYTDEDTERDSRWHEWYQ